MQCLEMRILKVSERPTLSIWRQAACITFGLPLLLWQSILKLNTVDILTSLCQSCFISTSTDSETFGEKTFLLLSGNSKGNIGNTFGLRRRTNEESSRDTTRFLCCRPFSILLFEPLRVLVSESISRFIPKLNKGVKDVENVTTRLGFVCALRLLTEVILRSSLFCCNTLRPIRQLD